MVDNNGGARWGQGILIVDRKLCLAKDGKTVVEADDEKATEVLVEAGGSIAYPQVAKLGLDLVGGSVVQSKTTAKKK